MVRTIVADDDPMVAEINRQYLLRAGPFQIDGSYSTAAAALEHLDNIPTDLLILGLRNSLPDNLFLLRTIRLKHIPCSVIMATTADSIQTVEEFLRLGVIDYLIKPYSYDRFESACRRYLDRAELLQRNPMADQQMLDRLLGRESSAGSSELHKGLNQRTLDLIQEQLLRNPGLSLACEDFAATTGLSKVTVRRYLNYLIGAGQMDSTIDYETGGRPRLLYFLRTEGQPK